jgi:heat shock protein HtpX
MFNNMNFRTAIFFAALYGVLAFIGKLTAGTSGLTAALIVTAILNFISYFYSDTIALKAFSAKRVSYESNGPLMQMVADLCENAQLPMPKVYIIAEENANAFATGRNPENASIAFTSGILKTLDSEELRAVAAHELSHIKNNDVLIGSVAATVAMAIAWFADITRWSLYFGSRRDNKGENVGTLLLTIIVAPILATLIKLAISRSREFLADECGAHISHSPLALASALEKIAKTPAMKGGDSYSRTSAAHLFISNPFKMSAITKWFSTHPPLEERVKRLRQMAS